jgi:hypothetical protein
MPPTALAATIHDPTGRMLAAIPALVPRLRATFAGMAFNVTDDTHPEVVRLARELGPLITHPTNVATIGRARRDVLGLALTLGQPQLLYSDFDHMLRWIDGDPGELKTLLAADPDADCLIIGRSAAAFAAEPARLRDTELLVNRVYAMLTGRTADLMFAVRRLSRPAAEAIVAQSRVDTLGNDVDWPLLAERLGFSIGTAQSDALYYRTMEEFGAAADTGDTDPANWIDRLEFAALHATAMRDYLARLPPSAALPRASWAP